MEDSIPADWLDEFEAASRQAQEIRDAPGRHGVRYLLTGKSAAILLGFPDTTQDAHLFVDRLSENGRALVAALKELDFALTDTQAAEVVRGKDTNPQWPKVCISAPSSKPAAAEWTPAALYP